QVRGDVALAAGICVRPPRAADVRVALPDHEIVDARLPQMDRHAEPPKAGADDPDACACGSASIGRHAVDSAVSRRAASSAQEIPERAAATAKPNVVTRPA